MMAKRAKVIAMVQLPPPMHGAAKMNRLAVDALTKEFDLHVIDMRFARTLSDINRFSLRKVWRALWLGLCLIRALPGAKALYICFAPSGFAHYRDAFYVLLAKLLRVPAILHLHGRGLPAMRHSTCRALFQKAVLNRQTVILPGERLRPELNGLNCNPVIIRNCLGPATFAPMPTTPWVAHDPVRLLWVSNLFQAKGIETLIAACAILRTQQIACDLTIAGAEGDMNKADLIALLDHYQMRRATTCLGAVSETGRLAAFKNADIFVFPSHYPNEAQPLVVLEAMASNVPVITSDIATLPEFVRDGETGRLCAAKDPEQLAYAIITAINAPTETTIMRDAAYRMCQEDFSNERFANRLTRVISSIVKRS